MKTPKFSPVELRIMDALWSNGACSVREIHESLPEEERPAFTTIQTMVYRLEAKHALRCTKRVGNANVFEAVVSRDAIEHRFLNDVLAFLGGGPKRVMAQSCLIFSVCSGSSLAPRPEATRERPCSHEFRQSRRPRQDRPVHRERRPVALHCLA